MADHVRKLHDTNKALVVTLSPATVDVTGATIRTIVHGPGSAKTPVIDRAPSITLATNPPTLTTAVLAGDFPTPGTYQMETKVTFLSGKVQSFPDDGNLQIKVVQDLG